MHVEKVFFLAHPVYGNNKQLIKINNSFQGAKIFTSKSVSARLKKSNRLYCNVKEIFEMKWYLQKNFNLEFIQWLSKIRLSSHKPLIERG